MCCGLYPSCLLRRPGLCLLWCVAQGRMAFHQTRGFWGHSPIRKELSKCLYPEGLQQEWRIMCREDQRVQQMLSVRSGPVPQHSPSSPTQLLLLSAPSLPPSLPAAKAARTWSRPAGATPIRDPDGSIHAPEAGCSGGTALRHILHQSCP